MAKRPHVVATLLAAYGARAANIGSIEKMRPRAFAGKLGGMPGPLETARLRRPLRRRYFRGRACGHRAYQRPTNRL
jgi:hypothetical protein